MTRDAPEEHILSALKAMVEIMVSGGFNTQSEIVELRTDDPEKILEEIAKRPWAHLRHETTAPSGEA